MATTVATVATPLATKLLTATLSLSTSEDNVTGGTGNIYAVEADNTNNTSASYVKLSYELSIEEGNVAPQFSFYIPASSRVTYLIPTGQAYTTGFTYWITSTAGMAVSQVKTGSSVTVRFLTT